MVDSDWKPLVYLGRHVETQLQLLVSCVVWGRVVSTLCIEKDNRGGEETSGFFLFGLF